MRLLTYFEGWKNRKYLQRIFLSVAIIMILILLISIFTIQHYAEKAITELQREEDIKTLNQINYNIHTMNEMVRTTAVQIFTNPEYFSLLYADEYTDSFGLLRRVDSFKRVSASATFLHSAIIYNGVQDRYFSYRASGTTQASNQVVVNYFLEKSSPILKLEPVYSDQNVEFFIMAYYDPWERLAVHNSAVILTVEPKWLFDNIELMNHIGGHTSDQTLFILSEDGNLFSTSDTMESQTDKFRPLILDYTSKTGKNEGFFITEQDDEKYIISFLTAQQVGWKIITVQSYDRLVGSLEALRKNTIFIASILLFVSVLSSIFVSMRIYRPIDTVMSYFKGTDKEMKDGSPRLKDEIKFMTQRYRDITNQNYYLKHNVAKHYHLRSIILDSIKYTEADLDDLIKEHRLNLDKRTSYLLMVIRIDHYNQLVRTEKSTDLGLYKFAVTNITEDILSRSFTCEVVELRNDHIAAIITLSSHENHETALPKIADEIRVVIEKFYKLSLTIAVSRITEYLDQMTSSYEEALYLTNYRISLGKTSLIKSQDVENNETNEMLRFPQELGDKLFEQLKTNKMKECKVTLGHIFTCIAQLSYDNMINSVLHLIHTTSEFIHSLNALKLSKIRTDVKTFYQDVLEKETLDEIQDMFVHLMEDLGESMKIDLADKNVFLIERVKALIEENYQNYDLNLDYIAATLNVSPGHLSKLFKESEKLSIIDFINEVRLQHTLTLLEKTEYSVKEIIGLVGYGSESYFYRIFKRKFGVTPKQYQLKQRIK